MYGNDKARTNHGYTLQEENLNIKLMTGLWKKIFLKKCNLPSTQRVDPLEKIHMNRLQCRNVSAASKFPLLSCANEYRGPYWTWIFPYFWVIEFSKRAKNILQCWQLAYIWRLPLVEDNGMNSKKLSSPLLYSQTKQLALKKHRRKNE